MSLAMFRPSQEGLEKQGGRVHRDLFTWLRRLLIEATRFHAGWTVVTTDAAYVASYGDWVLADTTDNDIAITLPDPSLAVGGKVAVTKTVAANQIDITATGGGNVGTGTTATLTAYGDSLEMASDGAQWWLV